MRLEYDFHTRDELWQHDIRTLHALHSKRLGKHITAYFKIIGNEVKFTEECPEQIKDNIIQAHFARFLADD